MRFHIQLALKAMAETPVSVVLVVGGGAVGACRALSPPQCLCGGGSCCCCSLTQTQEPMRFSFGIVDMVIRSQTGRARANWSSVKLATTVCDDEEADTQVKPSARSSAESVQLLYNETQSADPVFMPLVLVCCS